jgi:Flp pilus assembly protein TadD
LRQAATLAPDNAHYGYVYAIALNSTGQGEQARALLEQIHRQQPADRDVLIALVSMARDAGDFPAALLHARELATLYPGNAEIYTLIRDLQTQQGH